MPKLKINIQDQYNGSRLADLEECDVFLTPGDDGALYGPFVVLKKNSKYLSPPHHLRDHVPIYNLMRGTIHYNHGLTDVVRADGKLTCKAVT